MPLTLNLRHLEKDNVLLQGELALDELDLETNDEMVRADGPVSHDLEAQLLGDDVLVRGSLRILLACHCVRCLKPFPRELLLSQWTCLLPLKGEERVPVVADCVDLTPRIREDILLALPQHPVCEAKCRGLTKTEKMSQGKSGGRDRTDGNSSAWAALDKLKL